MPCSRRRRTWWSIPGLGLDLDEPVVALVLQAVRELRPALLDDPAVDEHVDEVRLDVAQDPRVVGDQQDADVAARSNTVDAFGDDLERIDVEPGVGLVEGWPSSGATAPS